MADDPQEYQQVHLGAARVRRRYSISQPTLDRWTARSQDGFPAPVYIGRLRFWRVTDLEVWERSLPHRRIVA